MNMASTSATKSAMRIGRDILVAVGVVTTLMPTGRWSTQTHAQAFDSGSDGSDLALNVAANQGVIIFDPNDTARWGRVLDSDGDGVYNFTTITVGSGSTLKLQGDKVVRPLYWLASSDVTIIGTLDLSGSNGPSTTDVSVRRNVAVPGAGGYAGGAGGSGPLPATDGEGPGGGIGGTSGCGFGTCGNAGIFTGNRYLVPLVGGSGGAGAVQPSGQYYGGGAGGGAILLASSTSIVVNGSIVAAGGGISTGSSQSNVAGGGSGGAIRLVAPTITGNGHLNVNGGLVAGTPPGQPHGGGPGWVRLEGFTISNSIQFDAGGAFLTRGAPVDSVSLRPSGFIRISAIDGVPVPPNSAGSFVVPDVTISKNAPARVDVQATGVPPGTVVTLQIFSQTPTDLVPVYVTTQATLTGTLQASSATVTFTFPYGFSRGFVRATWTQ